MVHIVTQSIDDLYKRLSPNEVESVFVNAIKGSDSELLEAMSEIYIKDFRGYMALKGFSEQFSEEDLVLVSGCSLHQASIVFKHFNSVLKGVAALLNDTSWAEES